MELFTYPGAALLALLVMLLPALAHAQHWRLVREDWRRPLRRLISVLESELGTVTVTYAFLPNGTTVAVSSTTAPTAAQAALLNSITAVVIYPDGDTTATLTHNFALTAADVTLNRPWISYYVSNTAGTAIPVFSVANTNAVVMTKTSGTSSGSTFVVILQRPHSMIT